MNILTAVAFVGVLALANAGGIGLIGSGIEGQYIPSGHELLHDNGQYRLEHHLAGHGALGLGGLGVGHGLGLVRLGVPGDGHEGQYIPSGNELLSDDGLYRGEHIGGLWH